MQPRPRTPSESARAVRVIPGVFIGTRNAVMPCPRSPGPRAREHDRHGGLFGVGHPHLAAADPVAVAGSHGGRLLIRGIGAGVGLRQRERADRLAARQRAEPALALLVASGVGDQLADQRVGHR
jgi:hypothetical protein